MTIVKIPGESPATYAARVRRIEIAVGNPDPGPSIADLLAAVRAGTQSRALNPCGQVAGGKFGPGNTCAAGDGSAPAPTPETPAPFQTGGPQPTGYKPPEVPPAFVGAGKSWAEVREENIKHFNRMRKRIFALQGPAKEKYLAAVEWKRNAQDAAEKWQVDLDKAYLEEQVASEASLRASMDPTVSKEEKLALVEAMSKLAKVRIQTAMSGDDIQRDINNSLFNYEKVKEANRNIASKVLAEEIGRVLREDGGKELEAVADERREKWDLERLDPKRLRGDGGDLSLLQYQGVHEAQVNLKKADGFLRGVAHPIIHHTALSAPVQYAGHPYTRACAGTSVDLDYMSALALAEPVIPVPTERSAQIRREASTAGVTYLQATDSATTVIHEYGHQIEHANREARDLAWGFSLARTAGSPEVRLKEKYPNSIYTADEIGRADDFAKVFAAVRQTGQYEADHAALYTGKRYDHDRTTEVVSMGVQLMEQDGAAFAAADPEYFDLVAGILTGRALTQTRLAARVAAAKARRTGS
jgi:hypothetical protein